MVPELLKKVLYRALGPDLYFYLQCFAKARDITNKIVWEKELNLLPVIIRRGETVIDVGANYAVYCYHLSSVVGPSGAVFAFEPIPFTYRVCAKLLDRFHLDNVRLYDKGCGNENGRAAFETPLQSFGAISAGQAHLAGRNNDLEGKERHYKFRQASVVECEIIRLDDLLNNVSNLSYIKLDIEGAEFFALQGAKHLLAKHCPVIQCEINPFFLRGFGIDLRAFLEYMAGLGYGLYFYSVEDGRHQITQVRQEDVKENNYLFLHPDRLDRVKDLLRPS